jgi:ribonuclease P protein subunit RPR2
MAENKRALIHSVASERIEALFQKAKESVKSDPSLAGRYVRLMIKISTHYRVKMPASIRNSICKNCNSVLSPGLNAVVRIVSSRRYVAYTCEKCGYERRIFYGTGNKPTLRTPVKSQSPSK